MVHDRYFRCHPALLLKQQLNLAFQLAKSKSPEILVSPQVWLPILLTRLFHETEETAATELVPPTCRPAETLASVTETTGIEGGG